MYIPFLFLIANLVYIPFKKERQPYVHPLFIPDSQSCVYSTIKGKTSISLFITTLIHIMSLELAVVCSFFLTEYHMIYPVKYDTIPL